MGWLNLGCDLVRDFGVAIISYLVSWPCVDVLTVSLLVSSYVELRKAAAGLLYPEWYSSVSRDSSYTECAPVDRSACAGCPPTDTWEPTTVSKLHYIPIYFYAIF